MLKKFLPWIIILLGAVLRISPYLSNRSFWNDEAMISLNIINRSFQQLFNALDYNQGAPIGFLIVEKLLIKVFGESEYVFRLFPLICGILSLIIFYKLKINGG